MRLVTHIYIAALVVTACGCGTSKPTTSSAPKSEPQVAVPVDQWDGEGPRPGRQRSPSGGPVVTACFSSDGKQLLTGDYLCHVALWSPTSNKPLWNVRVVRDVEPHSHSQCEGGCQRGASAVAFAADGKRVFMAWQAGVAQLDRETGAVLKISRFPNGAVVSGSMAFGSRTTLAFVPGVDECVYSSSTGLLRFDFATDRWADGFAVQLGEQGGAFVTVCPDGKRVLAWGVDRHVVECDLQTSQVSRFRGVYFGGQPRDIGYALNGNRIWAWGERLAMYDRQINNNIEVPETIREYPGQVWLSPDGKHAIGLPGSEWRRSDDRIDVIRTRDGEMLRSFASDEIFWIPVRNPQPDVPHLEHNPGLVVFTPDGKTVALTGGWFGRQRAKIGFWDVNTGKHIGTSKQEW